MRIASGRTHTLLPLQRRLAYWNKLSLHGVMYILGCDEVVGRMRKERSSSDERLCSGVKLPL